MKSEPHPESGVSMLSVTRDETMEFLGEAFRNQRIGFTSDDIEDIRVALNTVVARHQPLSRSAGGELPPHPDEHGHIADCVRDACRTILKKVVTFDESRRIASVILARQNAVRQEMIPLVAALTPKAPVEMREQSDAAFIRDLAGRMHRTATPAMGFDQGDTDRLYLIAYRLSAAPSAPRADGLSDTDLLDVLRDECWDLRSFDVPTGGDDADVAWRIVGHWEAEPRERVIAEGWSYDPRVAIRAALADRAQGEREKAK